VNVEGSVLEYEPNRIGKVAYFAWYHRSRSMLADGIEPMLTTRRAPAVLFTRVSSLVTNMRSAAFFVCGGDIYLGVLLKERRCRIGSTSTSFALG